MLQRTNIREKLARARSKQATEEAILKEVYHILNKETIAAKKIHGNLQDSGTTDNNDFNFDLLESGSVFHINQIREICIDYRLRFLDSKFFKGEIPKEAIFKIKNLERRHQTSLKGFKIIAPSKLFKLENADDPLLFAPLGNNYYVLIHKWGNDLNPFRKLLMMPFKCLENFVVFLLLVSLLLTFFIPLEIFSEEESNSVHFAMLFLFTFKSVAGIAIFYGFALGKNFSESIWNSKYFNA